MYWKGRKKDTGKWYVYSPSGRVIAICCKELADKILEEINKRENYVEPIWKRYG